MTHSLDDSPFAIHSHREITFILEGLAKQKTLITLDTHDGVVLVTTVLYVSGDGKYVCIDVATDDNVNDQIVDSKRVSFVTQSEIKVRWYSTHLQLVTMPDGKYAFSMHVPSVIERIQRRATGVHRNKSASLNDPVEGAAVCRNILDDRKRLCTPGFDGDGLPILEPAHVQLAGGRAGMSAMGDAVDHQRAHPADALAAVRIKGDRILP